MTATHTHGTRACYKLDGCRCEPCRHASSAYNKTRHRRIAYGTWQPYVDAEPVRQHINTLAAAGLGTRRIAELAGLDRKRITAIVKGRTDRGTAPPERIRPDIAAKILAVRPTALRTIDATGTRRRLQGLVAAGWPQNHLAQRLGMRPGNLPAFLARDAVTTAYARQVADLYRVLELADPAEHGIAAVSSRRARHHAETRSWAPPGCWDADTLDDPDAHPEWTGECGTRTGYKIHRREGTPTCTACRGAEVEYRRQLAAA